MALPSRSFTMWAGQFRLISRHSQALRPIALRTAASKTLSSWSITRPAVLPKNFTVQSSLAQTCFVNHIQHVNTSATQNSKSVFESLIGEDSVPRTREVHLFGLEDQDMGIMTKGKTEEIARENNCKVVLIQLQEDDFPVYTLMSTKKFMEEKIERKKQMKAQPSDRKAKSVLIGSKITDHDLHIKVSNVRQMLRKGRIVNVKIENHHKGNKDTMLVEVFKKVVEAVQEDAKMKRGHKSNAEINMVLHPVEKNNDENTSEKVKPFKQEELAERRKKAGGN